MYQSPKIFSVSIDKFGITRCTYCNELVIYPTVSKEQLEVWIKENSNNKLF